MITLPTLYSPIPNYRSMIQAILSVKFQNMPIDNTFLSKLIPCAIMKNVKSISGVNYIDSLHMKWCTLKNVRNGPFSPEHTLSRKTTNILRTAADMTKIETNVCRKHVELSVIAISNVLVAKGHLCNNFPNPLPQNFIIFTVCGIWFCSWYCKYLRYTCHFCSLYSLWCC